MFYSQDSSPMTNEGLSSIVELGWETMPLARRVAAAVACETVSRELLDDLVPRLQQIAETLQQCDEATTGRFVLGLIAVLNDLTDQHVAASPELSLALQSSFRVLGDLLVEIEATGQISVGESSNAIKQLSELVYQTRNSIITTDRSQQFPSRMQTDAVADLHQYGECLVEASGSLLNRVQHDDSSPYAAPLSRIHHLAMMLRDRLVNAMPLSSTVHFVPAVAILEQPSSAPVNITVEEPSRLVIANRELLEAAAHQPRQVLVIDESPFFRLLLGTAIESVGYTTRVVQDLMDAESLLASHDAWAVVICGMTSSTKQAERFFELMRASESSSPRLSIALVNDGQARSEDLAGFDQFISRTNLSALLATIRNHMGEPGRLIKKIA